MHTRGSGLDFNTDDPAKQCHHHERAMTTESQLWSVKRSLLLVALALFLLKFANAKSLAQKRPVRVVQSGGSAERAMLDKQGECERGPCFGLEPVMPVSFLTRQSH